MFDKSLTYICRSFLAFMSVMLIAYPLFASPLPKDFSAVYIFSRNGMNMGIVKRNLHAASDNKYVFESVSEATGFISLFVRDTITERSIWTYVNGKPRPVQGQITGRALRCPGGCSSFNPGVGRLKPFGNNGLR